MKVKGDKIITMLVGEKVWTVRRRIALSIISMAKQKNEKERINTICAVEKDNMIVLKYDTYETKDELKKAIHEWTHGGYKCYHTELL